MASDGDAAADPVAAEASALQLATHLLARPAAPGPRLVALDGRSGSGKTALAHRLCALLERRGRSCATVHLDDLYPGWDGLAAALPVLCTTVLTPLRGGRPARHPTWDWAASSPGPDRVVPPSDVVVVEGVGALAAPCSGWDLRVWLEAPVDVRRRRALDRDGDVFRPHWDRWAAQEQEVLGPVGVHPESDVVVDTVTGRTRWATLGA